MLKDIVRDYLKDKNIEYSIFIKDLKSGENIFFEAERIVPSASIIKLFIMAKVFQLVNEEALDLNFRAEINNKDRVPYRIIYSLDSSNSYTIKDLLILMIMQSDNTATNTLIDIIGMDNINRFIKEMGFQHTVLKRKMMDFKAKSLGRDNYSSAEDVGNLLELMYLGDLVSEKYSEIMLEIMKMQLDDSMIKLYLKDEVIVAHKTGDLSEIKHDAGIVYTENRDYIFIMFITEDKEDQGRGIIGKVSKLVYDYFTDNVK
jgi:beta-lactamase class A